MLTCGFPQALAVALRNGHDHDRRFEWSARPPLCDHLPMRSSITRTILTVRRRCLVCDVEAELDEPVETDPIGVPCPSCRAPTERNAILARRTVAMVANPHASALGRLGGLKGGPARAAALSPERRREIAQRAARKRWARDDE